MSTVILKHNWVENYKFTSKMELNAELWTDVTLKCCNNLFRVTSTWRSRAALMFQKIEIWSMNHSYFILFYLFGANQKEHSIVRCCERKWKIGANVSGYKFYIILWLGISKKFLFLADITSGACLKQFCLAILLVSLMSLFVIFVNKNSLRKR